jgi:predicted aspartyl protease
VGGAQVRPLKRTIQSSAFLCVGLFALTVLSLQAHAADPATTVVEQPMQYHGNGSIGTPVYINNKGPIEFIVDTGATLTGIWNSTVQQQSLRYTYLGSASIMAADGVISLRILKFETLNVGALELKPPILTEFPDVYAYYKRPLGGILGADFLKNHVVVFDFPRNMLVLYPKTVDLTARLPDYFDAVPLQYKEKSNAHLIKLTVNGTKVTALLDTGASVTTLLASETGRLKIDLEGAAETAMTGVNGRALKAWYVNLSEIKAGKRTWPNPRIVVSQFTVERRDGFTMLLGIDLLGQTPFAIDYGRNRLLMVKPSQMRIASGEEPVGQSGAQGLLPLSPPYRCSFPAPALEGLTCATAKVQ